MKRKLRLKINLYQLTHQIFKEEKANVKDCGSGWISSEGAYVKSLKTILLNLILVNLVSPFLAELLH